MSKLRENEMIDYAKRWNELSPNKQALLALRLGKHKELTSSMTGEPAEKKLVAYVVAERERPVNGGQLRGFLKSRLPDYMLPEAFVMLDDLPLSPNGKLDRKALGVPVVRHQEDDNFVAPRTALEEELAHIWATVLKVERVGVDDDFFELGGHSLLATQLISRVREAFHVELPLRSIFEAPTIAGLATTIVGQQLELAGNEDLAELLAGIEEQTDDAA
jgi:acyl carrier protein